MDEEEDNSGDEEEGRSVFVGLDEGGKEVFVEVRYGGWRVCDSDVMEGEFWKVVKKLRRGVEWDCGRRGR